MRSRQKHREQHSEHPHQDPIYKREALIDLINFPITVTRKGAGLMRGTRGDLQHLSSTQGMESHRKLLSFPKQRHITAPTAPSLKPTGISAALTSQKGPAILSSPHSVCSFLCYFLSSSPCRNALLLRSQNQASS